MAPGAALADRYVQADIFDESSIKSLFQEADVILPAIEDEEVLKKIMDYGSQMNKPVIFDEQAYEISSSKRLSNQLFRRLALPMPKNYPNCGFPIMIKPDGLSGSIGVYKVSAKKQAASLLQKIGGNAIVQEYLEGRSFSLEVIGDGKQYFYPQITEVVTDNEYDAKRIIAPADITKEQTEQFLHMAQKLAKQLKIKGIFDIEVICHNGTLKLLEIDARLPSQTPVSVYHSTGINMIKLLVELQLGIFRGIEKSEYSKVCFYQQIRVQKGQIDVLGERIMKECSNLKELDGFYGADKAITDYAQGKEEWRAIVIVTGDTVIEAHRKFFSCIHRIKRDANDTFSRKRYL